MDSITSIFYLFSAVILLSALRVVTAKNPVHAALFLVLAFFSTAASWMLIKAEFLAIALILIYVGAVMVLFLFVIMLMNLNQDTEPQKTALSKVVAGVIGGLLLFVMVGALRGTEQLQIKQYGHSDIGLVKSLGNVLFHEYLFPFEIVSVLLLSALVGAIMIGKKEAK